MYSTVVCLCCRNKFPKNEGILPNKMEFEKPDISFSQLRFFCFSSAHKQACSGLLQFMGVRTWGQMVSADPPGKWMKN